MATTEYSLTLHSLINFFWGQKLDLIKDKQWMNKNVRAVPELNVRGGRQTHIFHPHYPPTKIVKDPHHQ